MIGFGGTKDGEAGPLFIGKTGDMGGESAIDGRLFT